MSTRRVFRLCFTICLIFILACCEKTKKIVTPVSETSLRSGVNHIEMEYDGLNREMIIQLPSDFQQEERYPVVLFFHGFGGNKNFGHAVIGPIVEEESIIGIYPQGIENSWNTGGGEVPSTADDIGFTLHILDWIGGEIQLDELRIYSLGYSNGGAFSYTLALKSNRFAAIASISASFFEGRTIEPMVSKLAVIQIHGELDKKVPYHGGQSSALSISFESAMNTVQLWARHNGLGDNPVLSTPEDRLTVYTFRSNGNPHEVRLYCMHETTHHIITHPFISSNRCYWEIWEFFKQHPKVTSQY